MATPWTAVLAAAGVTAVSGAAWGQPGRTGSGGGPLWQYEALSAGRWISPGAQTPRGAYGSTELFVYPPGMQVWRDPRTGLYEYRLGLYGNAQGPLGASQGPLGPAHQGPMGWAQGPLPYGAASTPQPYIVAQGLDYASRYNRNYNPPVDWWTNRWREPFPDPTTRRPSWDLALDHPWVELQLSRPAAWRLRERLWF